MSRCRRGLAFIAVALAAAGTALAGCGRSVDTRVAERPVVTNSPTVALPTPHPPARNYGAPADTRVRRHANNNGFKQHYELGRQDQELADAAARRLRPKLRRLQDAGEFSREALRKALVASGLEPIGIVSRADPARNGSLVFWSKPRIGVCVDGKLTADTVVVETEGPSLDGGCGESDGGH